MAPAVYYLPSPAAPKTMSRDAKRRQRNAQLKAAFYQQVEQTGGQWQQPSPRPALQPPPGQWGQQQRPWQQQQQQPGQQQFQYQQPATKGGGKGFKGANKGMKGQGKKHLQCFNFKAGFCAKGDACPYGHF